MTYIPGYNCPRCGAWVGELQTHACASSSVPMPVDLGCTSSGHDFRPFRDWGVIYCRKCGETRAIVVPASAALEEKP